MSRDHDTNHDGLTEQDRTLIAAYRGESAELPPQALDDAIRAAARKAVGARPGAPGRFRYASWNMPLAAAATVVLSATVAFMAVREHGLEALREATPPRGMEAAPALSPRPEPSAKPDPAAPGRTAPAADSGAGGRAFESASVVPAAPLQGGGVDEARTVKREAVAKATEEASARMAQDLALKRVAPGAGVPSVETAAPPSFTTDDSPADRSARAAAAVSPRNDMTAPVVPQSTPVLPGPALDDRARVRDGDAPVERAAPPAVESTEARTRTAGSAAASLRRETEQFKAASPTPADGVAVRLSPDERVERIRSLLRGGQRAEALAALSALRKDHPDYTLPADLSVLVKELPPASR